MSIVHHVHPPIVCRIPWRLVWSCLVGRHFVCSLDSQWSQRHFALSEFVRHLEATTSSPAFTMASKHGIRTSGDSPSGDPFRLPHIHLQYAYDWHVFFWAYCKFKNKMCGSFFELWSNIHKLYHLISLLISRICLVFHHQLQIPYWSGCRNGQIFAMLLWGLQHVWIPGWTSRSVLWQLRGDYRCDHGWIPQYWCSPWWWVSFAYLLLLLLKHQKWSL